MPFDAIIVLANLMDRQGNLNEETHARLLRAVSALKDGEASTLVPCGWAYRDDSSVCIADSMKRVAMEKLGIAGSAIVTETASRDTVGDAVFTKRHLAAPRGWSRIQVVTSNYHLPRALEIFSFVYGPSFHIDGLGVACPGTDVRGETEKDSLDAFRRTFEGIVSGDDDAIYERLRARHPYYNGEVHPVIDG